MKIGFDLDGTLDRPILANLCKALLAEGHEVHVITGTFSESGAYQAPRAKRAKLMRIGIPFTDGFTGWAPGNGQALLHVLDAVDVKFGTEYRLRDLGLRKGALCEEYGVEVFFDDSEVYCEMIPKMSGGTTVLQVS
jgi:hypothetical protein